MASWLVISTYKLIHQWSRGAAGQTQHVIQVTIYVVYIQQITENVLIFLHYSRDDGLFWKVFKYVKVESNVGAEQRMKLLKIQEIPGAWADQDLSPLWIWPLTSHPTLDLTSDLSPHSGSDLWPFPTLDMTSELSPHSGYKLPLFWVFLTTTSPSNLCTWQTFIISFIVHSVQSTIHNNTVQYNVHNTVCNKIKFLSLIWCKTVPFVAYCWGI